MGKPLTSLLYCQSSFCYDVTHPYDPNPSQPLPSPPNPSQPLPTPPNPTQPNPGQDSPGGVGVLLCFRAFAFVDRSYFWVQAAWSNSSGSLQRVLSHDVRGYGGSVRHYGCNIVTSSRSTGTMLRSNSATNS